MKPWRAATARVSSITSGAKATGTSSWTLPSGSNGLGRFALQVKGGRYLLIDGEWYLKTREGIKHVRSCPLDETKLAALDWHDDIKECAQTVYNPYVIPVLMFPDMEPDQAIEQLAKRAGVYVDLGRRQPVG